MKLEYVKRNNKKYKVITYTDKEICVEASFQFADGTKKILKLWWNRIYLDPPYNKSLNLTSAEGPSRLG